MSEAVVGSEPYIRNQPGTVLPRHLSSSARTGFKELNLFTAQIIGSNAIPDAGNFMDGNTDPEIIRVNGATDKMARLNWVATSVVELQFAPETLPPDLDDDQDIVIHLNVDKDANVDTTANIDVQVFFNRGDTECGDATAAITETSVTEKTVRISASDIPASPGIMTVCLVPSAHDNDALRLYSAWYTYTKKA